MAFIPPCSLSAQGVPTFDHSVNEQQIAKVTALVEDLQVQRSSLTTRQSLADVQLEQLSTLEEMTAAMTGRVAKVVEI
jgi:hypothetical protein